nr:hypothetical protein Clen_280 [Cedratvirus lena]WIL04836.1 hypothetical protein Cduv_356 [Cedratvirus duvanny]
MDPVQYIVFCAQDANFQTRSMLIPYDLFPKDYLVLLFTHSIKTEEVDNLLLLEFEDGCVPNNKISSLICKLTNYADGVDGEDLPLWYKKAKINLVSGFNHVANYNKLRRRKNVKLGFLVLEER